MSDVKRWELKILRADCKDVESSLTKWYRPIGCATCEHRAEEWKIGVLTSWSHSGLICHSMRVHCWVLGKLALTFRAESDLSRNTKLAYYIFKSTNIRYLFGLFDSSVNRELNI